MLLDNYKSSAEETERENVTLRAQLLQAQDEVKEARTPFDTEKQVSQQRMADIEEVKQRLELRVNELQEHLDKSRLSIQ